MSKVSDLGILRSGIHLRGAADPQPDGRHVVIQLGDVRDGEVNMDRVIRMDLERARPKDFLAPGNILLRSRGASYGAAPVPPCPGETLAAAPLYVLRLTTSVVEPEYLVWFLNRPATQALLRASARGTHIPTVSTEAFAGLEILLPALKEQRRILTMEKLLQEEKELTLKHLEQRAQLVRAAQEMLLSGRYQ